MKRIAAAFIALLVVATFGFAFETDAMWAAERPVATAASAGAHLPKSVKPAPAKPGKMDKRYCDQDCVHDCELGYQDCMYWVGFGVGNPDDCQTDYNNCSCGCCTGIHGPVC
jgi:hypothetical protein